MTDEEVLVLGGSPQTVTDFSRTLGARPVIPVTRVEQLAGHAGGRLIVLNDYIRAPQHYELLVAARAAGLTVVFHEEA